MDDSCFVKQALRVVFEKKQSDDLHRRGSVLMDVPECSSFSELVGQVEVCTNGTWGVICNNFFNDVDAAVICQQLGHNPIGIKPIVLVSLYFFQVLLLWVLYMLGILFHFILLI